MKKLFLLSTVIAVIVFGMMGGSAKAFPFIEIDAFVNPDVTNAIDNNDGTWDITLDYSFKVTNDGGTGAEMNYLSLEFENDVFSSVNSFSVTDPSNWTVESLSSGTSLYELSSAGDTIAVGEWLFASANVTIFEWALNSAGDPDGIGWNEGQIWAQSVFARDNMNGGDGTSTAPVPEPATMLLLGTGLIGLAGASRKKIFRKK